MISRMSDPIRNVLLEALLDLIASIELSDDEVVDADFADEAFNAVAAHLQTLSRPDRELLATLIAESAAKQTDFDRREVYEDAPDDLGLLDED